MEVSMVLGMNRTMCVAMVLARWVDGEGRHMGRWLAVARLRAVLKIVGNGQNGD